MNRFSNVIKNISYTLTSNVLTLCVSIIVSLLLPKILGVAEYGYYQLYIFYVSYVGLLHLGWCDGIYLRYGGEDYKKLDTSLLAGQFYSFVLFQLLLTLALFISVNFFSDSDFEKRFVLLCSILNIVIMNVRTFLMLLLQTTNRMKEYSEVVLIDRLLYVVFFLIFILMGLREVKIYIIIDILTKVISLILAIIKCSDIPFSRKIKFSLLETKLNVFSGINLMLANIASMLIIGVVRFGIQNNWDVETFGKISLTLSISNMLMIFVGAISLAIFPLIKRTVIDAYKNIYPIIRTLIMPVMFSVLLLYFPAELILSKWLPEYTDALKYMVIVFPMIIFESKVSLLTNTFLKAMRKEKVIFQINLLIALLSVVSTIFLVYLLESLFWSMLSIVILLGLRSSISEIALKKYLDVNIYKDMIVEIMMVILFITLGWNLNRMYGFVLYSILLIFYLYFKKNSIKDVLKMMKAQ